MKSQFVKLIKQQGNGNGDVPDHIAAMTNWSSVPDGDDRRAYQQPAPSSHSGLLSNWNADNGQGTPLQSQPPLQSGARDLNAIVEQDTLEQRSVQGPPQLAAASLPQQQAWQMGRAPQPVNPQVYMNGPVSPRESGITPYASLFPNQSVSPAMQAQPARLPISQPLNPNRYAPNPPVYGPVTNAPIMPVPGYTQFPMQPVGGNGSYQAAGGPPYIPPMSAGNGGGGNGGNKRPKKKRRYPIWARVVTGIMVLLVLTGGGLAYYLVNFSGAVNNITNQQVQRSAGEENPNQGRSGPILSGPRINILLLGSDTDQKFGTSSGGSTVYLAQTDIIVTIDPTTKAVGMLSIPRDFYINIPGYGMGKLDEAFEHGYSIGQGGFAGAVDLSRQTIQAGFWYSHQLLRLGRAGWFCQSNRYGGRRGCGCYAPHHR